MKLYSLSNLIILSFPLLNSNFPPVNTASGQYKYYLSTAQCPTMLHVISWSPEYIMLCFATTCHFGFRCSVVRNKLWQILQGMAEPFCTLFVLHSFLTACWFETRLCRNSQIHYEQTAGWFFTCNTQGCCSLFPAGPKKPSVLAQGMLILLFRLLSHQSL